MAPRKEKTEKASADEAPDLILDYLRKNNRPYSANDISSNLHNKVTKAAAVKYLKDMHERQQVVGCVSGKAIVYHLPQSTNDLPSPETLTAMSNELTTLRSSTNTLALETKALKTQLAALGATVSISELRDNVAKLEKAKQALTERVDGLRASAKEQIKGENDAVGSMAQGGADEKKKVEVEINLFTTALGRRMKIAVELWDVVREMRPAKVKNEEEWKEVLGIAEY